MAAKPTNRTTNPPMPSAMRRRTTSKRTTPTPLSDAEQRLMRSFAARAAIHVQLLMLVAAIASLAACGGPGPAPAPPQILHREHPPKQGPIYIGVCAESDQGFTLTGQSLAWVAQGLAGSVASNHDQETVVLTFIDANSLDSASSPLVVAVPAVQAYPPEPTPEKYAPDTSSPWQNAKNKQEVDARNKATIDAYNAHVVQIDGQLTAAKDAATKGAAALRSATPPAALTSSDTADVWGCYAAQARRFSQLPPDTTRVLLFASSMDERHGWTNQLSADELAGIKGSHIVVSFFDSQGGSAAFNQWKQTSWERVWTAAGAAPSRVWMDPAQTAATSPSMLFAYATASQ